MDMLEAAKLVSCRCENADVASLTKQVAGGRQLPQKKPKVNVNLPVVQVAYQ